MSGRGGTVESGRGGTVYGLDGEGWLGRGRVGSVGLLGGGWVLRPCILSLWQPHLLV